MVYFNSTFLGVSKAILEAAGQAIEKECQDLGKNMLTPSDESKVDPQSYCNRVDNLHSHCTRLSREHGLILKHSTLLSAPSAAQANPGMIMTQPGNLKCKKILHLIGQTDPIKINRVVNDALKMCVQTSQTSVSFPAIGTGETH